jgi:hypothetical protein
VKLVKLFLNAADSEVDGDEDELDGTLFFQSFCYSFDSRCD